MQCSTERNTRTQLLNLNKIRKRATNAKRGGTQRGKHLWAWPSAPIVCLKVCTLYNSFYII